MSTGNCPICNSSSEADILDLDVYKVKCPRCGEYLINGSVMDDVKKAIELDDRSI
jgi:endogenous inhibitor of DNA gyrase (YacG/DUF329 family)